MENASKALIIAGGVLIGIIIISIGTFVIMQFANFSRNVNDKYAQDRINEYNAKFQVFERNITAQEMVTLINLVKENNNIYDDRQISLIVGGENYSDKDEDFKIDLMKNCKENKPDFQYVKFTYNSNGYISEMKYKKIT